MKWLIVIPQQMRKRKNPPPNQSIGGSYYNVYTMIPDYEWNNLSEKKKALLKFEIKVSLYDDFYVKLEDIFEYVD